MATMRLHQEYLCTLMLVLQLVIAYRPERVENDQASAVIELDSSVTAAFENFVTSHGRTYKHRSEEYEMRRKLFAAALAATEAQNSKPDKLWTAGINGFSDRTPTEMKAFHGWRGSHISSIIDSSTALLERKQTVRAKLTKKNLPEDHTWTNLWATSKGRVRNQNCANCWAAATVQMLEAHAELHTGINRTFSMGELTQCTPDPFKCGGEGGCSGSTPELALAHVVLNGLGTDDASRACPEHAKNPVNLKESGMHEYLPGIHMAALNDKSRAFGMIGWQRLEENKYEPLVRALVEHGPVAVAVATDWNHYKEGIFDSCEKGGVIGHSMLLIGYGKNASLNAKYWHLQNSWGSDWGENGHIRLLRTDDEESYCGDDNDPKAGTACDDGPQTPKSVRICGMCGILYDNVVPFFDKINETRI